ncbi:fimbrial protein [Enterobacter sp. JS8-1]|uniref:fimbrial protein n=1 Tax=Enterobacter sp. JS8-1 TaxID=3411633 RepID=UPI003BA34A54
MQIKVIASSMYHSLPAVHSTLLILNAELIFFETKDISMKKIFSIASIASIVMVSASAYAASEGQRGTVEFTGSIKENTCVLNSSSVGQVVPLGEVESSVLSTQGSVSQAKKFSIKLDQCNLASASITFSGIPEKDDVLRVTGTGTVADGVGIQILDIDNNATPLKIDGSSPSALKTVGAGGFDEFYLAARYIAFSNNITAGEANGTVSFTVKYE